MNLPCALYGCMPPSPASRSKSLHSRTSLSAWSARPENGAWMMARSVLPVTSVCSAWSSGITTKLILLTSTPFSRRYVLVTNSAHAPKLLMPTVLPSRSFGARMPDALRTKYFMCGASCSVLLPAATTLMSEPLATAEITSGTMREPKSISPVPTSGMICGAATLPMYSGRVFVPSK